jgi:2-dehydro-3-deoxygalactonokinase
MTSSLFIAGDWGTSNLRLSLCRGGEQLDQVEGPGIATANEAPESLFLRLTSGWTREHGRLPALLCGMVGSRNGWREAPYAACPTDLAFLRSQLTSFVAAGHEITIVPGLACTNPLGAPDVMRSEETQLLGALDSHPELTRGRRLFVLPGTHTKWVVVEDGGVATFLTAPVGELFALLREHSTLAVGRGDYTHEAASFALGLERIEQHRTSGILHLMFEVRSRQLRDGMTPAAAMGFLSGLLVGADVVGALEWFGNADEVVLIGTPTLNALYAQALERHAVRHRSFDGRQCAMAGLAGLFDGGRHHAA